MASWQTAVCPYRIDFAAEKLDEIRIAVVDAFYAVPRGGVEIGGVLYGKRAAGQLEICDFRKIQTEYLTGPSFRLSEHDKVNLKRLMAFTRFDDPQIWPLGFFVSHTRSGIRLSECDEELYREFFPEPWQVALVLKPEQLGPVRGGYFFRDADGVVNGEESAEEFILEPQSGERRAPEASQHGEDSAVPGAAPVASDALSAEAKPEVPGVEDRVMFQAMARESWRGKNILLLAIAAAAVFAAACITYWLAVR
jgi:hypothetical protein